MGERKRHCGSGHKHTTGFGGTNAWEVKAEALRTEDANAAIKKHPDLAPAFAVVKAAEIVAKDKFKTEPDQHKFVGMVRNTLAERIATTQKIPEVKIAVREPAKEQTPVHDIAQ